MADLSSGTTHMIFYPYQGLLPVIQSGKMRALATTGAKRSPSLPDFPTMVEQGVADYNISAWLAFNAPAGTPKDRVQVLYNATRNALLDPKVAASLSGVGYDADLADPAEYAEFTKHEVARYRQIIQGAAKAGSSNGAR
ncbi:MAG: hypothetical protein IT531_03615 [Burkholderiales bacterium]|nr:hypothetical protein [Burkholderiales bacterium]